MEVTRGRFLGWAGLALLAAGCAGAITSLSVPVTQHQPARLAGDLYRPAGPGPFPAVILLHGCAGPTPNVTEWALWLRAEGYAALALDSFGGRGLRRLCGDSRPLPGGARADDVFAAARSLRAVPWIDAERIGAVGFSHGGWTVLWAASAAGRPGEVPLRAFVAFYPSCGDLGALPGRVPLLLLLGGQDDWTPAAPCERLAEEARAKGGPVLAVTYPQARHSFDGRHIQGRVMVADALRGRGATIEYDPRAHADAERRLRRFLAEHLGRP